jgi:flagellar biosynthesis protein FlhG
MTPTPLYRDPENRTPDLAISGRWCPWAPPRVISVTSGKGGVGKSSIVVNLGLALARKGLRVLLIDADLGLANLDVLLGLTPRFTLHDVLSLRRNLAEVIMEGPEGIKILPASSGIPELADLNESEKLFLLNELDLYSDNLDMVLIDTESGISRNVLFFNLASQQRILVVNNQPTSLTDAYALVKVLALRYGVQSFQVLVNGLTRTREAEKVYHTLLTVSERFLGQQISLEYLGFIPQDEFLRESVLQQQPVLSLFPQAPASKSFTGIAQSLLQTRRAPGFDGNIKFFWRRLLRYP